MRLGPAPSVYERGRFGTSTPGRDYPAGWIYADSLLSMPGEKHEFFHLAHPDYDGGGLVWARVRERDGTA